MHRLSQDAWDAILDVLRVRHVARLWTSGDVLVQSRIMHARKRSVSFGGKDVHKSDLFNSVLARFARHVDTDCLALDESGKAFNHAVAIQNLESVCLRRGWQWMTSIGHHQPVADLSHLTRLHTCHIKHRALIKGRRLILPPNITDITLCAAVIADLSSLKHLTRMRLMIDDADEVERLRITWPLSLSHFEIKCRHTSPSSLSFMHTLPTTLAHLAYMSSPMASVSLEKSVPPQCTSLQSIYFDCADFGITQVGPVVYLPPSLTSLDIHSLLLPSGNVDKLLDFVPTTVTAFSINHFAQSVDGSFQKECVKLMERLTAESVEMQVFRSGWGGTQQTDEDTTSAKVFAKDAKRILAKKGLAHDKYITELLDVDISTVVETMKRLPPAYGERIISVLKRFYGKDMNMLRLADTMAIEAVDSIRFLFLRGITTGISVLNFGDAVLSMSALMRNANIALQLERLHFSGNDRWFAKLFPTDILYPRLKRISAKNLNHHVIVDALFKARHNLPLLEEVKLSPGEMLRGADLVAKMAALRLYGYTKVICDYTVMMYHVSPPWYYVRQLEGEVVHQDAIQYES